MAATDTPETGSVVRCAIYTRKSTEEGLEQAFNSLDAQREAAEAYILSQAQARWAAVSERYDDGGFTGGNLERPALQRLLCHVEAGQVDCVVVHRVDRLSRSLLDFARIMGLFESRSVSFVSVTQQFNTTVSLGRLTLNILLSSPSLSVRLSPNAPGTRSRRHAAKAVGRVAFRCWDTVSTRWRAVWSSTRTRRHACERFSICSSHRAT
jgi:site-specific DNA recombinase